MLNRMGQSVPPMLLASKIRRSKFKSRSLIGASVTMGVIFCLLAVLWQFQTALSPTTLIAAILVLYAIFFSSMGIHQLVLSALIGKLIPVLSRGKLMQLSSVVGSIVAVTCAWYLLNLWLQPENANFSAIFLFAGVLFIGSGLLAGLFVEQGDIAIGKAPSVREQFQDAGRVLKGDRNFLILVVTACLFGMMMTLFPHYQAVGRERLNLGFDSLVPWIIAQNMGVAVFSLPAGWLADRIGNRLVLKWLMGGLCLVPMLSLWFSSLGGTGASLYFIVFAMLGLTPVTMRTFSNYTLELVSRDEHPTYLSLLSLFMAGPAVVGSLLVGALIDRMGYEPAFVLITISQFLGFLLCFRLSEPRQSANKPRSLT